jgi:outer membrane protein TolC
MKRIFIVIFLTYIKVCAGQRRQFTEEEFISVVQKYHPVAMQATINIKIAEADVTANRSPFDPVLKMDKAAKEWDGVMYYNEKKAEIIIPTWYGIDLYTGKEDITGMRINPEETKGTLNYIGFSVPVVKNLLIDKRRAALRQAKIFKDASEVERRMIINDLLQEALHSYWNWWEQYHIYQLMQSSLSNAEKRLLMVKTAFQLGDRPAIDTLEAFTQVQSFSIKLNESFTALAKARLQLSAFLWTNKQLQYDLPAGVIPQTATENEGHSLNNLLQSARAHPELTQYTFKLKALSIDKKLKFQSFLPQVNLKYNQTGYNFSKTVNAPWFENNYRFGISLSMPLRLSEGRGEYQKARLKIDKTQLEQVNKEVLIYTKVKQYHTEWEQTKAQLLMQKNLVTNVEILKRGEETRFANGEGSLFLINTRELRGIEAQQKLIGLSAKNQKALVTLKWAAGLLGT